MAKRERKEKVFKPAEKIIFAGVLVVAVIGAIGMYKGVLTL